MKHRHDVCNPTDEFAFAVRRAESEYLEMPGLLLTEAQASRLWALDEQTCRAIVSHLVARNFLIRTRGAAFARA